MRKTRKYLMIYITFTFLLTMNVTANELSLNPKTEYAKQFIELNDGETWLLEEVEKILQQQGKSINTLKNSGDLKNVYALGLNGKGIVGKIPKAIGELKNIENIYLSNNNLTGEIPKELYELSNLKNLDLSLNNLSGGIDDSIKGLKNIETFFVQNNNLSGAIPNELVTLENIISLDLSSNNFNGTIPESIGDLQSLKYIALANNNLSGELPQSIFQLSEVENIILWGNSITGEISEEIANLDNLKLIDVSDNNLSGDVPKGLGDKGVVIVVDNNTGSETNNKNKGNIIRHDDYVGNTVITTNNIDQELFIKEIVKNIALLSSTVYISGNFNENGHLVVRPDDKITKEEVAFIIYSLIETKENIDMQNKFNDVKSNMWSYEAITYLSNLKIINGYNGNFNPKNNITRGEFATILSNLTNLEEVTKYFEDTKNHWSHEYVSRVATKGYMLGMPDGLFYPNKEITRAEVIVTINRVLKKSETNIKMKNKFIDLLESHWAYEEILKATN